MSKTQAEGQFLSRVKLNVAQPVSSGNVQRQHKKQNCSSCSNKIQSSSILFKQINTEVVNVQTLVGQVVRQSKGESSEGESDRTERGTLIIFRHNPTGANRLGETLQKLTSLPGGFLFATIFLTCLH